MKASSDNARFSLRTRLIQVMLLILFPVVLLNIYGVWHIRQEVGKDALDQLTALSLTAAQNHDHYIKTTEELFGVLTRLPAMRKMDVAELTKIFTDIVSSNPMYASFLVVNPSGYSVASGVSTPKPIYAGDRVYFKNAMAKKKFVIGEYNISRTTQKPVLHMAQPILDIQGNIIGVLIAGLDLNWFGEMTPIRHLPSNSSLLFMDGFGKTLYHSIAPMEWLGEMAPEFSKIKNDFLKNEQGFFESTGIDGIHRLLAYRIIQRNPDDTNIIIIFCAGIPTSMIYRQSDMILAVSFVLISILIPLNYYSLRLHRDREMGGTVCVF